MAEKKTVLLRLSPKLWEEVSQWAEDEFRSINGQIEYLLHDAVNKRRKSRLKSKDETIENGINEIEDEKDVNSSKS